MFDSFKAFIFVLWTKYLHLPPPTKRQYEIADFLQYGPRKRMIQAFRGIGKSYLACAYVVWRLWRNPQLRNLLVSANEKKAAENAMFIKLLIDTVDFLEVLRGGKRDSVLSFDVGPAQPSPSPSVRCDGIFGQITGARSDILLPDDIEVPKNSETETMREKLENRAAEFASVMKPGSECIYLGTPQTEESTYRHLPAKGYEVRIWPARYPLRKNLNNYRGLLAPSLQEECENDVSLMEPLGSAQGGMPTDPERFDDQDLIAREAEYRVSGFMLQFMLDTALSDADKYPLKMKDLIVMPVDKEIAPVKVAWASSKELMYSDIENLGFQGDRCYAPMYKSPEFVPYQGSVMVIDPAGRGKDETAFAVTKHLNGMIYLTRAGGLQGGYSEETLTTLAQIAKAEQVNAILIESNFGDGMYLEIFKPILHAIYPVHLEEYKVSGQKELRILDKLEPVVTQHRLVVDESVIRSDAAQDIPKEYKLFYQLTHITRAKGALKFDDRLDALAEAVGYWTQAMAKDAKKAEEEHRKKLLDKQLQDFMKRCKKTHGNGNRKYVQI